MKDEFLKKQTKEQLIIFLHNDDYIIDDLRTRLYKLTGCGNFGGVDGMNDSCIKCFYNNKELFQKCESFKFDKLKNSCYNKRKEGNLYYEL